MEFKTFTAGPDDNDRRLDRILRKLVPADSLGGIYKAIRKGLVKINDRKVDSGTRIFQGDRILIAEFLLENSNDSINSNDSNVSKNKKNQKNNKQNKKSENFSFTHEIIFQNKNILAINKPYDRTVQGNEDSLNVDVEKYYQKEFESDSLSFTPGPLHRLDRKTTGILCFSLSLEGARWFSQNILTHKIRKTYVGIAEGKIQKEERWEDSIERSFTSKSYFQTVKVGSKQTEKIDTKNKSMETAKTAITIAFPLAYGKFKGKDYTFAKFTIETGRTHQIRAQSAFHNHPLLGDMAYGGTKIDGREYFLHAYELIFPENNQIGLPEKIFAPIPKEFQKFLKSTVQDYEKFAEFFAKKTGTTFFSQTDDF